MSICHEDSDSIAFMDIQPVNNGHVLVVPREHYESLLDVPPDLAAHLFQVSMRIAGAVRKATGTSDLNIVISSGEAAGQDEPHYHVHIIPRRKGDGFNIPLPFDGSQMPDRTVLDAYAAQIIAALSDPMRVEPPPPSPDAGKRPEVLRAKSNVPRADAAPTERSVALPSYDESTRKRPSSTPPSRDQRPDARWRVREGAHGELLYEPNTGTDDAA